MADFASRGTAAKALPLVEDNGAAGSCEDPMATALAKVKQAFKNLSTLKTRLLEVVGAEPKDELQL